MKNKFAQCLCDIANQLQAIQQPCQSVNMKEQLNNIATQFNQIIITDTNNIVSLLKQALADQFMAAYQYWAAMNNTRGTGKVDVDPQFKQHYEEQMEHAEQLISRIKQLGDFPFNTLQELINGVSKPNCGAPSHKVCELLDITINAEKDAIELYNTIIKASQSNDPVTHKLAKSILADQEEHLYDLQMLKEDICC